MPRGICTLCGYDGEINSPLKQPDLYICLACYMRFYADKIMVTEKGEEEMGWDTVGAKSGKKDPDVVSIAPNTVKLVHVLLPDTDNPVSYWTHYIPNKTPSSGPKGRVVICPGRDTCPACAAGIYRTKLVHAINVWDYEEKAVKILEGGNAIFQPLKQAKDQMGTLSNVDISIKKTGTSIDTQYFVLPIPIMQPFDQSQVHGLFPVANLRLPHNPAEVQQIIDNMSGASKPATKTQPTPISDTLPPIMPPQETPIPQTVEPPLVTPTGKPTLQFGKYKGRSVEDVYTEDPNYIKWCAENVADPTVKAEANRVINNTSHLMKKADPIFSDQTNKQLLVNQINELFQFDERYKGNFASILEKMKAATTSAKFPNGKTILAEYTVEELETLINNIK